MGIISGVVKCFWGRSAVMWKQSGGACYFSLTKAAVLFKRDSSQSVQQSTGLIWPDRHRGSAILKKIKAIFHSLFYPSCRAPVVVAVVVILAESGFSAGLKIFCLVSVAWILKHSTSFLELKYNTSAFSARYLKFLKSKYSWLKIQEEHFFVAA